MTVVAALSACASPVQVDAAPFATEPRCAEVLVALRSGGFETLAGRDRRETTAQSTAAWGEPAVVLRCGVEPPGPTTDACVRVDEVDWVLDDSSSRPVFTTYGRAPALEVSFPPGDTSGSETVLVELSALAEQLPQERACL